MPPASQRRRVPALLALLLTLTLLPALSACARSAAPSPDGRLGVVVSVPPQRYFVERIGGEHVAVSVMVGPGDSPHTYEPKPEQLVAISKASLYFAIGGGFEDVWLGRITAANPAMRVVDTTAGIALLPLQDHQHDDDAESGDAGDKDADDHAHDEELDTHVWVSPQLVAQQARTIHSALVELDPDHAAAYDANLTALLDDIAALDADLRATLAGLQGARFMVFHPAWGYLARDYGLEQIAIEVGGQEPSAQELAALIAMARAEGIRVVFAQPEMSTADAETIAREIGGEVLLISPLAEDWLDNMRAVAEAFRQALAPASSEPQ